MSVVDDLKILVESRNPIVVIESVEEDAVVEGFRKLVGRASKGLYRWSVTTGLKRIDLNLASPQATDDPAAVLQHIKSNEHPGIFVLPDFHPYLSDPKIIRLVKEIAQQQALNQHTLVLVSHKLMLPPEVSHFARYFPWRAPDRGEIEEIINTIAAEWLRRNGRQVSCNQDVLQQLINNMVGLVTPQISKLARGAIEDDGVIDESDLPRVMQAKFSLLDQNSALHFEYDTAGYADLGGQARLKKWLELRKPVFASASSVPGLPTPKGLLLLGVQGCGKSLAAKAVAGMFGVPLLRLDFGALFNKYHGETERNLREALKTAELMEPCVLWMDEIEKGMSISDSDEGVSRRMLGSLLTWMAERKHKVFLVATSNDIEQLPPELIRKGRFDEIFFVDLPAPLVREEIFRIHLKNRGHDAANFDLAALASAAEGFSGAEIEQVVVSALYAAHGNRAPLDTNLVLNEIRGTYPLSVTMAEQLAYLREWAQSRAVPVD